MNYKHIVVIIAIGAIFINAQNIEAKIGGNSVNESFKVLDSDDNTLFKVQGDGSVSIGNDPMWYKLNVDGTLRAKYFTLDTGANDGYVLKSDIMGNATWQEDFDISAWFTGRTYSTDLYEQLSASSTIHQQTVECNDTNDIALSAGYSLEAIFLQVVGIKRINSYSFKVDIYNGGSGPAYAHVYCNCLKID